MNWNDPPKDEGPRIAAAGLQMQEWIGANQPSPRVSIVRPGAQFSSLAEPDGQPDGLRPLELIAQDCGLFDNRATLIVYDLMRAAYTLGRLQGGER